MKYQYEIFQTTIGKICYIEDCYNINLISTFLDRKYNIIKYSNHVTQNQIILEQ